MTTATTSPAATLPLCATLVHLLNVLGGAGGGRLHVRCWSPGGIGFKTLGLPAGRHEVLPGALLAVLEDGWAVSIGAAVRQEAGDGLARLHVLHATFPTPLEFDPRRREYVRQPGAVAAAQQRLRGFPVPATLVLDGWTEVVALWALAQPLDLADAAGAAHARQLQRRLAQRLGASMQCVSLPWPGAQQMGPTPVTTHDADDPAAYLPVPGSLVRDAGTPGPVVAAVHLEPAAVYALADLTAALGAKEATR